MAFKRGAMSNLFARVICYESGAATVLLLYGEGLWYCVRRPDRSDDTGISFEAGPHQWWQHVDVDSLELIVERWLANGTLQIGRRVTSPRAA